MPPPAQAYSNSGTSRWRAAAVFVDVIGYSSPHASAE